MKLIFHSIELENLGSFGKSQTLKLDRPPGLYYLRGDNKENPRLGGNGCGKTTIWRALCWVLFAKTPNGLRTPDLEPWNGAKGVLGAVTLTSDEFNCTVVRTSKPNKLFINDSEATQTEVDKLIGMSIEMMINTIILPQGAELFLDLKPTGKLQLLTDALTLDRWENRSKTASKATEELVNEQHELEGELLAMDRNLTQTKALREAAKQRAAEWEQFRQERMAAQTANRGELEAQLVPLQNKLGAAQLAKDSAGTELKALYLDLDTARDNLQEATTKVTQSEWERRQLIQDYDKVQGELKGLAKAKTCPTCGQTIKVADLAKHKAELAVELSDLNEKIESSQADEFKLTAELLQKDLHKKQEYARTFEAKEEAADTTIAVYLPQVVEVQAQIKALSTGMLERTAEENPHTDQSFKLRRAVTTIEQDMETCAAKIETTIKEVECTGFWVKGFKDVQLYILEEVLKEVEVVCNAMLPDVGLDGWEMLFAIERETQSGTTQRGINVLINSPEWNGAHGLGTDRTAVHSSKEGARPKAVPFSAFSGGEGQRLRIVAALSLSEVLLAYAGVTTNIEVLDEPTTHLSAEGTDDMCTFLANRAKQLGIQCWWTDHAVIESVHFAKTITVVRDAKGSHIEEAA